MIADVARTLGYGQRTDFELNFGRALRSLGPEPGAPNFVT